MYVKRSTKNLLLVIAVIAVIALLWGVFATPKSDEDYTKQKVEWSVGGIDENGLFITDTKDTMVSNLIEIQDGYKIVPEYTSGVSFDIYFFDELGVFHSIEESNYKTTISTDVDNLPEGAFYLRIVMHPEDSNDDINFVEKLLYANQIEVFTKVTAEIEE